MEINFLFLQLFIIAAVLAGAEMGFYHAKRALKKIHQIAQDSAATIIRAHERTIKTLTETVEFTSERERAAQKQIIQLQSDLATLKASYIKTVEDFKLAQARANHRKLPK